MGKNKIRAHQSLVVWGLMMILFIGVNWMLFSMTKTSDLMLKLIAWIAIFFISMGILLFIGVFIWIIIKKSLLEIDFGRRVIIVRNPVLFRKKVTEIRFDEISKINLNKVAIFSMLTIKTNRPHEKSGMTSDDGMTISATLYFITKKSYQELKEVFNKIESQLNSNN